ncbi:NAD(P)H-binding protein [Streptomyces sp. NPDC050418]|uniref:NAD(P)H-binding protein n=1 Tax=Streptomyces sp. NPDC050418 TaxID=3365612 RepID=UPI00378C01CB
MILITGGRGAVATRLTTLLHRDGLPVRVGSARPDGLTPPDGVETVRLDLTDPATFHAALSGVTTVFLYASAERITDFIDHAHRAAVTHIVLLSSSSVLGDDPGNDPLAAAHHDVERALLASPITTTILRPGSFASNVAGWAWAIKAGRSICLPFPEAHDAPLHEADLAEAAHAALTDSRHRGGRFTLTGPESLTFAQQAGLLAAAIGRPVPVDRVTPQAWKQQMADHLPAAYADALLNYWESNDKKPFTPTGTVEDLTGHPARTFSTWAADHARQFTAP